MKPGEWTRVTTVADVNDMKTLSLDYIIFDNYREGDTAYVDDIIVAPLGE